MFHKSMQEVGVYNFKPTNSKGEVIKSTKSKARSKKGYVSVDMGKKTVEFRELWALSKKILLAFQEGGWDVGYPKEKKRYDKERQVLMYLVKNRSQAAIAVVRKHYLDKLEIADVDGNGGTMYFIDQKEVVQYFYNKWSGQEDLTTTNDKLRVVGLLVLECNRERTTVYVNKYTKSSEVLDNPVSLFVLLCFKYILAILTFGFVLFMSDL